MHTLVGTEPPQCKIRVILTKDCLYYSNVMVCLQLVLWMVKMSNSNDNLGAS